MAIDEQEAYHLGPKFPELAFGLIIATWDHTVRRKTSFSG